MDIQRRDLIELTTSVCESLAGLALSPVDGGELPSDPESVMTACVHITGATRRTVTVECVTPLARRIAQSMFKIPSIQVTADDARDSLGEIANVIAGNVKAVSSTQCDLSLPTVECGDRSKVADFEGELRSHATFTCGGQILAVSVLEPADPRTVGDERTAPV